jgi:hypothetical protein
MVSILPLSEHQAMKAYWWSGGIATRILLTSVLDAREWSASCPSHFNPKGKNPCYSLDRRLGGLQGRYGCGGELRNS